MRIHLALIAIALGAALGPRRLSAQGQEKPPAPSAPARPASEFKAVNDTLIRAVDKGLSWLAKEQTPDGAWLGDEGFKLNNGYEVIPEGKNRSHVGATALAGLSFLANGQVPGRGPYGEVVDRAIRFILSCVQDNGYINANGSRMYSHAFATLFLAEASGMAKREDIREKLSDAVHLIVDSQNQEGGWRYVPFAKESDMSITVCQVMALRAARNVGIAVPKATIERAVDYVKKSAVRDDGRTRRGWSFDGDEVGAFRYQFNMISRATFPLTAAGIVTLYGAGVYSDGARSTDRDIERGLNYLDRHLEEFSSDWGPAMSGHYFFYYGHYYAAQAMYIRGDELWERYFTHIRRVLLSMQSSDGSWPNEYGPGRAYGTATATLILQIPYRYLPIFQR